MDLSPHWNDPAEQEKRLKELSTYGNIKMSIADWAGDALTALRKLEQTLHAVLEGHSPERHEDRLVCKTCWTPEIGSMRAVRARYPCAVVLAVAQNLNPTVYRELINRG